MNSNPKLSYAIAVILSGSPIGFSYAATATGTPNIDDIQEIVVTAQRRTENIQNVPITIQAFPSEILAQLNVQTFDDIIKYLPNVTSQTNGPGQGNIYMRGLSSGGVGGSQSSGSTGQFPNVAIYLDDQSGQLTARNLDIYAADLERIEVLEGPQGTLFGAGAQAGVVRYITNKPKLNTTEGSVTAGYSTTAGGANNSNVEAMINLPLIPNTLAVRAVIYNDDRGGYINNVPSTFTRHSSDLGIHYANYPAGCGAGGPACQVPPGSPVINNNALVQNAINPVTYQGIRASALYAFNSDWDVLLTQTYQTMNAQGVFYQMPNGSDGHPLPPLSVTLFNPSYDKDSFENTAWTVKGKFGDLKAVYTGGYLVRNVDQAQDYTNYSRGEFADYYQCIPAHTGTGGTAVAAHCYSPSSTWQEQERNTHQSHEFRLSTPDDWRLRGIVGAFWEENKIYDQGDWEYKTAPACTAAANTGCLTDIAPVPGSTMNNPAIRNDNTSFIEDIQRGYRQYAFFASGDFDLIPKVLTFTAGTRYYDFSNYQYGSVVGSAGCGEAGPAPCEVSATNLNAVVPNTSQYHGFKSRANLSWHVTPDTLLYYTWSQGFRPGGFNRLPSPPCYIADAKGVAQYCIPTTYASDTLTNNEIGWKTEFFDHRFQWNGAVYQENWDNAQLNLFQPAELGNLVFTVNGPDYRIRGFETSIVARITGGLSTQGSVSYNHSKLTNSPDLSVNNPQLAGTSEFDQPITSYANPYGSPGSPTANSPVIQYNLRMRYEWTFNDYNAFAQVGGTHIGSSLTQGNSIPPPTGGPFSSSLVRFLDPAYSIYDASIGVAKGVWNVTAFGQNLSNSNASTFTSAGQFVTAQTVLRPRVLGVKFGYKF